MLERVTLEEAISLLRVRGKKIQRIQEIPVAQAGGYRLAEDVYAKIDNPPFPRSPLDGYAVNAKDLAGATKIEPVKLKVIGCIYAGEDGQACKISSGEAMRIMTGAPFPIGSDTVVKQEDTNYGEDWVQIYKEQKAFDNYCFQGEDYTKDSLLLKAGEYLTFAEQGILSGIGQTTVKVFAKPRVYVITTGDEVCEPGKPLQAGKIYNANAMLVSSRLRELGVEPVKILHVADQELVMAEELKKACMDADLVITMGGVSVGKKDILHGALASLGAEKIFWRVQLQPGTPSIFSVYQGTCILSLSGNPFGAMANLELLVRPALYQMTESEHFLMEKRKGVFVGEFSKQSKIRRFVRAIYRRGEVRLTEGNLSAGAIGTLRGCNCLLEILPETQGLKMGDEVTVWML